MAKIMASSYSVGIAADRSGLTLYGTWFGMWYRVPYSVPNQDKYVYVYCGRPLDRHYSGSVRGRAYRTANRTNKRLRIALGTYREDNTVLQ
jgi:hypothetical protein